MNPRLKNLIRELLPPAGLKLFYFLGLNSYGWSGDFASWGEAKRKSTGYDESSILEKVKAAALKVKNGESAFERDSVNFAQIEYSWPVTAALLYIYAREGKLNLIDFGGSLGSSYFQNRKFLSGMNVSWRVVEQKHFVDCGNSVIADERIGFYPNVEAAVKSHPADAILFSSVLQYLEKPHDFLAGLSGFDFKYVIVDRTPFTANGKDRLTIQKVPPAIYSAVYPCWFFDEALFLKNFDKRYQMLEEFEALDKANIPAKFKGFIFERKGL